MSDIRPTNDSELMQDRLRHWQEVRSWARLIKEAQKLWHDDAKALRRLGALEISQLFSEVPPVLARRVHMWLDKYSSIKLSEANLKESGERDD